VILAVDPGKTCGWAIFVEGSLVASGSFKTDLDEILAVFKIAKRYRDESGLPLVVVGEKWGRGGRMNPETAAGLGAQWGPWYYAARSKHVGGDVPLSHILRVHQRTWRTSMLGVGVGHDADTWKKLAAIRCKAQFGIDVTGDRAEAILIGFWGGFPRSRGEEDPSEVGAQAIVWTGAMN
jgi:hypothetical protein